MAALTPPRANPPAAASATVEGDLHLTRNHFTLNSRFQFPIDGITALFGPSGAGKSTLLRIIAGFEKAAHGTLRVGGSTWQTTGANWPAHKRPVGYVFQEASLFEHLSVRDNLLFGFKRVPRAERLLQPDEVIEQLGLATLLPRPPGNLSGGEKQRVALGRALLTSPKLLLLDEPLSALDKGSKLEILPYLENLRQVLPAPVLYVSHSHEEVARLSDYLLLMQDGRIVAQGPATELANRLDSPLTATDQRFSLLHGVLEEHLPEHHLSRLKLGANSLLVPAVSWATIGQGVRLRVQARDVSLCLTKPTDTSILNILPAEVTEIAPSCDGLRLLLLGISNHGGKATLMAAVSELSFQRLKLQVGQRLYAQIKATALVNQS